jgi:hypothetical protein
MPETTGGKFNPGDSLVADMTGENRAILIMLAELLGGKVANFRERGVNGGASMALAQNKAVTPGPAGFGGPVHEGLPIKHSEDIRYAESCADVRTASAARHVEHVPTDAVCESNGI